jgi:hypothetical protein
MHAESAAPILGLDEQGPRRNVGQEWRIEALVRAYHRRQDAVGRHEHRRTSKRLLYERFLTEDAAELLRSPVAGDPTRQRPKPRAVSTREDESPPRLRGRRGNAIARAFQKVFRHSFNLSAVARSAHWTLVQHALPRRAGAADPQLPNRRLKKVLTLWPKETAPSRTFSAALLAWGSAAFPAS